MKAPTILCRICDAEAKKVGTVMGKLERQGFHVHRCPICSFAFVANPLKDYDKIYSHDYYCGRGADPSVDYLFELEHPEITIRQYEWRGILNIISSLTKVDSETRWLDYGCGNGGLVQYCKKHTKCKIVGFERGWIRQKAASKGIPYLDDKDLEKQQGSFNVVTAIEVLEHIENPLESLKAIRALLKPGGLFFYTTGNALPFRERLLTWSYVVPEIHISFFEPQTLDYALRKSGFTTEYRGFMPGYIDIVRFKILKNYGWKKQSFLERILPWTILTRIADKKYRSSAHPIAWA